jgi:hypothetical protein
VSNSRRIKSAILCLAGASGAAALIAGSFAAFTSTVSSNYSVSSGIVRLDLSDQTGAKTFETPITNVLPGDQINKFVDLTIDPTTSAGSIAGISFTLAGNPTSSSLWAGSSGVGQLTFSLKDCSVAWAQGTATTQDTLDLSAAPVEADTATCADAGGGTVLIPPTPINGVGSTANLINGIGQIPNALTPGTTHYFMETLVLPSMDVNNQGYVNGSPDLSDNTNGTAFENAGPLALTSTFVAGQRAASVING